MVNNIKRKREETNNEEFKKDDKDLNFRVEYRDGGIDNFGLLRIETGKGILRSYLPRHIIICLDTSVSLLDIEEDGYIKFEMIKNILIRLVREMYQMTENYKNYKFFLSIITFNDKVMNIIEDVEICNRNINKIIEKISKIKVEGLTNYDKLFKHLVNFVNKYNKINTINMIISDGNINYGETNIKELRMELSNIRTNEYFNIRHEIIGYGKEQNSIFLYKLSKLYNCSYYGMSDIDKISIILGEIFHDIRETFLVDIEIKINNGLIYDYKNSEWKNSIKINYLLFNSEKKYSIVGDKMVIEMKYKNYDGNIFERSHAGIFDKGNEKKIIKHYQKSEENRKDSIGINLCKFRQKILEYMNIVRGNISNNYYDEEDNNEIEKICFYFREFIRENNLENNSFCKRLLDDIQIMIYTNKIRDKYSYMNLVMRLISLGSERIYNINNLNKLEILSKNIENRNDIIKNEFGNLYNIKQEANELLIKMDYFYKKLLEKENN